MSSAPSDVPPPRPARHPSRSPNASVSSLQHSKKTAAEKHESIPVLEIPSAPNGKPLTPSNTFTALLRSSTLNVVANGMSIPGGNAASSARRAREGSGDSESGGALLCGCLSLASGFLAVHAWYLIFNSGMNALRSCLALTLGHVFLHVAHPSDTAYSLGSIQHTLSIGAIGGVLAGLPFLVLLYIFEAATADDELMEKRNHATLLELGQVPSQLIAAEEYSESKVRIVLWTLRLVVYTPMGAAASAIGASVLSGYVQAQILSGPYAAAAGAFGMFLLAFL